MKQITIEPIKTEQVDEASKQAVATLTEAQSITITSQEGYGKAAGVLKTIKGKIKLLDTLRKGITKPLDEAKGKVMNLFRTPLTTYADAEAIVKKGMLDYSEKQEELRKIEQAKLEKKAEEDRKKKEDQEAEWRKKEEEKRKEAERLEKDGMIEEAKKAQEAADKASAKADERAVEQQNIIAPTVAAKVSKTTGVHYIDKWYGEVINKAMVPEDYKIVDTAKLNKVAQATKGTLKVSGVQFKKERILASRSK